MTSEFSQAGRIQMKMKPVTRDELEMLGATVDNNGVWTFRDGSKGKISKEPVPVYDDEFTRVGFTYFDAVERVQ